MLEETEAIHWRPQSHNAPLSRVPLVPLCVPSSPWTAERGQPFTANALELEEGLAEKSEESISPDLSSLPLIVF